MTPESDTTTQPSATLHNVEEPRQADQAPLGAASLAPTHGDRVIARQCTATATTTGQRCRRAPIRGGSVCYKHGGATRQVKRAAARRLAEAAALRSIGDVEVRQIVDPLSEFAAIVSDARAWYEHAGERVAMLEEYRHTDEKGGEQLRAEIAIYERAIDRVGKLLVDWVRLGLDERMVRLSEVQHQFMADLLDLVLADLGVADDPRVPGIVEARVRELTSRVVA